MFWGVVRRELRLAYRRPFVWLTPLFFFVLVGVVFSIAVGAYPSTLRQIAIGVIWTAALLSGLLASDSLFRDDFASGYLEQAVASSQPLFIFVCAKVFVHWLLTGVPLLAATPLMSALLNLSPQAFPALLLSIPFGTIVLSLLAAFGAALTLGQNQALLLPLLILPFCLPVLIFAVSIADSAAAGMPLAAPVSLLAALALFLLTVLPFAIASVLRSRAGA